jgi:hypothetical protein
MSWSVARSLLYIRDGVRPCGKSLYSINDEPYKTRAAMRIYDIEFDIDSFLDEMEEMQRARRQRQQQVHRGSDVGAGTNEGSERDAD